MNYLKNFAVSIDQMFSAVFGIPADCTVSAYSWLLHLQGKAEWPHKIIDTVFFWEPNHCKHSYNSELTGKYQAVTKSEKLVSAESSGVLEAWQVRFIAEYQELYGRISALSETMRKMADGTLEFTTKCDYSMFSDQLSAMNSYRAALEKRAAVDGIPLSIK